MDLRGVVYRRIDLPLRSNVIRTTGGFGDPDDRLIIEASVSSEDVELLLTEKTIELGEELKRRKFAGRTLVLQLAGKT